MRFRWNVTVDMVREADYLTVDMVREAEFRGLCIRILNTVQYSVLRSNRRMTGNVYKKREHSNGTWKNDILLGAMHSYKSKGLMFTAFSTL